MPVFLTDHLVPLLKICNALYNVVSSFSEHSSSNKVQQRVSNNFILLGFCVWVSSPLVLANYYSSGKEGP